jgi:hypothetical protein
MARWMIGSVLAVACVTVTGSLAVPAEEEPRWITDYAQARAAARASGKPIFLVFR